jgi:hypothetical protein
LTPCSSSACTSSSSWRSRPAACTCWELPPAPQGRGQPSKPGTCSWTSASAPPGSNSSSGTATASSRPHSTTCSPATASGLSERRSGRRSRNSGFHTAPLRVGSGCSVGVLVETVAVGSDILGGFMRCLRERWGAVR